MKYKNVENGVATTKWGGKCIWARICSVSVALPKSKWHFVIANGKSGFAVSWQLHLNRETRLIQGCKMSTYEDIRNQLFKTKRDGK